MAAPTVPTPLTTMNYSILAKLKLTPTPLGMRTEGPESARFS